MPKNSKLVLWFIIGTFVVWLAFDAWLGPNGGPTESQTLAYLGKVSTSVPYLIGALSGHWFFNRVRANYRIWWVGFVILGVLIAFDATWAMAGLGRVWFRWAGIWFLVGIPCGSYFWPQDDPQSPVP